jgi:hypothetical protein
VKKSEFTKIKRQKEAKRKEKEQISFVLRTEAEVCGRGRCGERSRAAVAIEHVILEETEVVFRHAWLQYMLSNCKS